MSHLGHSAFHLLAGFVSLGPLAFLAGPVSRRRDGAPTELGDNPLVSVADALLAKTELPAGEAGLSLAGVHVTLQDMLPPGPIAIYEAGGGSTCYLPAALVARARVTLVDIDPVQVANNDYAHERVCADIQSHRQPPESADLVVSYNVIEHIERLDTTLIGFGEALRPGGLLLIGAPHPRTLSGLATRYSPHWFHVWFYRYVRGDRQAGEPGHAPFPVHYHPLVLPERLKEFLATYGFEPIYERVYESPRYAEMRQRHPRLARLVDAFTGGLNALLRGRINLRDGDYHLVLRKRVDPAASAG